MPQKPSPEDALKRNGGKCTLCAHIVNIIEGLTAAQLTKLWHVILCTCLCLCGARPGEGCSVADPLDVINSMAHEHLPLCVVIVSVKGKNKFSLSISITT